MLKEVPTRPWTELRANDVLGRAAQLSYYFFLALFPFLIFVIASLSVFGSADRGRALLFSVLSRFMPTQASQLLGNTFDEIIQFGGPLKMSFGTIFSLWSASMGMNAIMDTLNAAYGVKETRSFIKQYTVAVGLTLGIAVLLITAVLTIVLGNDAAERFFPGSLIPAAWKLFQWPLVIALFLFTFAAIYHFAPDLSNRSWQWISPGSLVAVIFLTIVSIGLRLYMHYSSGYTAAYGSLGAVITLLLFLYMSGVAVLSGGVLNAVLQKMTIETGTLPQNHTEKRGADRGHT
jgi:membrane protein